MRRLGVTSAGVGLALLVGCSVFGGLGDLKGGDGGGGGSGGKKDGGIDGSIDGGGWAGDSGSKCPPGKKECAGACVDMSDPSTGCGGPSCDPCTLAHASSICVGGACVPSQCEVGFEDCNGDGSDGCEAPLKTDPENCGTCLTSCALPHASVSCQGGACKFDGCDSGFADCDADPKDGCEVNTQSDPDNCGACGTVCTAPTGKSATCSAGQCGISNCAAPLEDCDKDASGSCETNLSTSLGNCGFCGNACSYANATAGCSGGNCALQACKAGYTDCDGNTGNGCETNTGASTQNCGTCGKVCAGGANAAAACSNGSCALNCNAGFGNCNGTVADGCETALNTLSNCGSCGKAISASGNVQGGNLVSVSASGNTLQFAYCDNSGYCGYTGNITLSGATASGSIQGGNLVSVSASGSALQFSYCDNSGYCGYTGNITLSGATASGSIQGGNLVSVSASGNTLQFSYCDNSGYCGYTGNITLACKP